MKEQEDNSEFHRLVEYASQFEPGDITKKELREELETLVTKLCNHPDVKPGMKFLSLELRNLLNQISVLQEEINKRKRAPL